jgi:chaperone modulatory protein CbpM
MSKDTLTGLLLDEELVLTLEELSRACSVQSDWIVELVNEAILQPGGSDTVHWRFSGTSLCRARTVKRLQQDLGVNIAGAALVLDLVNEIESLRTHLSILKPLSDSDRSDG